MAIERKDEVLEKALSTDSAVIPRFDIILPNGLKLGENVQLVLKNPVLQEGMPINKEVMDECLAASGVAEGTKKVLTLNQPNYVMFDGALVRFQLFDALSGAATLNVNNTGAKRIKTVSGDDPDGFTAGTWVDAIYSATKDQYIITGGGGSGGGISQNINLLEEVVDMKYCKVLSRDVLHKARAAEFLNDALISTAYRDPDTGWEIYAKIPKFVLDVAQGVATLTLFPDGTVAEHIYPCATYKSTSSYVTTNTSKTQSDTWQGRFCFVPVTNKPGEIALVVNCIFDTDYYGTKSEATSSYQTLDHMFILDRTTGDTVAYSLSSSTSDSIPCCCRQHTDASMWCYWNETYGAYYYPSGLGAGTAQTTHKVAYMTPGAEARTGSVSNLKCGYVDSSYSDRGYHTAFTWMVDDTHAMTLALASSATYFKLFKYNLTDIKTASAASTISASSTDLILPNSNTWPYSGSSASAVHVEYTDEGVYFFVSMAVDGSLTSGYPSGIMRYGPFSMDTAALSSALSVWAVDAGKISSSSGWKYYTPLGCMGGDVNALYYVYSTTFNDIQEYVYAQCTDVTQPLMRVIPYKQDLMQPHTVGDGIQSWTTTLTSSQIYLSHPWYFFQTLDSCVYAGEPVLYDDEDVNYWECPEDGIYKIILVGGGAAGGSNYGGGSGYLNIATKQYQAGDRVPYHVGAGELYVKKYTLQLQGRATKFDDLWALHGTNIYGGANGFPAANGGGGGGYDLVDFGGNGQTVSNIPHKNGGQGSMPAIGYGAGGCAGCDGRDGCIVIIR